MNPWSILEIDSSSDVRQIKRAYAKKLKSTKPDEKPEEFQILHQAYKNALAQAENTTRAPYIIPSIVEERPSTLPTLSSETQAEVTEPEHSFEGDPLTDYAHDERSHFPIEDPTAHIAHQAIEEEPEFSEPPQELREYQDRVDECHRLLAKVDELLSQSSRVNSVIAWDFLTDSPFLLEEQFQWQLGQGVFNRIANFNQRKRPSHRRYVTKVGPKALAHLDALFDWTSHQYELNESLGDELCAPIFSALESCTKEPTPSTKGLRGGKLVLQSKRKRVEKKASDIKEYYFGGLLIRALATIIDLAIAYGATSNLLSFGKDRFELLTQIPDISVIIGTIVVYFGMLLVLESSSMQASIGKQVFKLKVTNRNFRRISFWHNCGRILSFVVTLPFNKLTWFINCFLGGNLLHDRMSATYVIDMRKTLKNA